MQGRKYAQWALAPMAATARDAKIVSFMVETRGGLEILVSSLSNFYTSLSIHIRPPGQVARSHTSILDISAVVLLNMPRQYMLS